MDCVLNLSVKMKMAMRSVSWALMVLACIGNIVLQSASAQLQKLPNIQKLYKTLSKVLCTAI